MSILFEERPSDSPYIASVTRGRTVGAGAPIRPAEVHWHMVFVRYQEVAQLLVVGPWSASGVTKYVTGAEILWIKFKLGTFMPHLITRDFLNTEVPLPGARDNAFWLKRAAWQFPDYENVETFVDRLGHDEVLVRDPLVDAVLQDQPTEMAPRTVRHRFLQATGLTQKHIRQYERAQRAVVLLQQGTPILDTVFEAGYYDQSHLTRALKRFIGYTPAQIAQMRLAA
jgi:hypothetical protein